MKTKCPYCGAGTEISPPAVSGEPTEIGVIPARVGMIELGCVGKQRVVVLGLEAQEQRVCFAITTEEFRPVWRELGALLGQAEAQEGGWN